MNDLKTNTTDETAAVDLTMSTETVRFLIQKLREYDAQSMMSFSGEEDELPNPLDDADFDALREHERDYLDEPLTQELRSFLGDLSDDEKIDLVAIAWTGRNGLSASDWESVRSEASDSFNARTVDYLLGTAGIADLLDDGLAALGHGTESGATSHGIEQAATRDHY